MRVPPPETLALATGPAPVTWRRSKQARRITLRIDPALAAVVVTLPPRGSAAAGRAMVAHNAVWVADQLAALPAPLRLIPGAMVPIDGEPHPIRHVPEGRGGAWLEDGALCVSGELAFVERRAGDFLRAEARRRLSARACALAAEIGHAPSRVVVRDSRSRWGSCSVNRSLMFCWRLIFAPLPVQLYVVAHEVAHLRFFDHGEDFWVLTDSLSPDRALARAWLAENGPALWRIG